MKKIGLFLVMLLTMVAFTACSSDDDDEDNNVTLTEAELVGTWNMNTATINGKTTSLTSSYVHFKSDHSYTLSFEGNTYVGTWTLKGNTITGVTPDPITEIMKVTSKNGNTVHIDYSNSIGTKMSLVCTKE